MRNYIGQIIRFRWLVIALTVAVTGMAIYQA